MTLSYGAFYTLVTICTVVVVVSLFLIAFRWLKNSGQQIVSLVGSLILAVGILTFYLLKSNYMPVVEVRGFDCNEYVLVFNNSFTTSDGQSVFVNNTSDGAIVVNITDQTLYVETIEYSLAGVGLTSGEKIKEVPAHSYILNSKLPDFYPWDTTPEEISVSGPAIFANRIWAHF